MSAAFELAYGAWRDRVANDRRLRFSSATDDFTSLPEYAAIVALGSDILPEVMERIAEGDFLLNTAAFVLAGLKYDEVVPDPAAFYSEQEISAFLLARLGRGAPA